LSTDQSKPGDDLKITINTKPNSFVGLLGVDQSVLLLKKGNDLERSAVFSELGKFNDASRHNNKHFGDYNLYYEDFALSGAAIITNGKEEIRKQSFNYSHFS
jgi:CD109 antigen